MRIIPHKKCCVAHGCTKPKASKKRFCPKHAWKHLKETDLCKYTYFSLKANAKRRGKPFHLTLDQFREFCDREGYLEKKGRAANAMTIDRKINSEGYHVDNIRPLSNSENASKHTKDIEDDLPF